MLGLKEISLVIIDWSTYFTISECHSVNATEMNENCPVIHGRKTPYHCTYCFTFRISMYKCV